jgi:membrane dipeptidase
MADTPLRVVDLHCDTALEIQAGVDLGERNEPGHVDLPRMEAGRVGAQLFAAYVAPVVPMGRAWQHANELLDAVVGQAELHAERLRVVDSVPALRRAWDEGRIGVILSVENGHAIEEDWRNLERLRRRGVRAMTLTHSANLSWAGSSGAVDAPGLTAFGREIVRAMEDLGILIDVSHVSDATLADVIRVARKPFVASHSNAWSLCPCARNLKDEQLRAIADAGGMVGINLFPGFLDPGYERALPEKVGALFRLYQRIELEHADDPVARMDASRKVTARLQAAMRELAVPIERVCEHIEHMIEIMGDEAVGFGADLDGVPDLPAGVGGCDVYPRILDLLCERGVGEASLVRIASENFLRVLASAD